MNESSVKVCEGCGTYEGHSHLPGCWVETREQYMERTSGFDHWFAQRFPVIDELARQPNGKRRNGMKAEDALDVRKACSEAWKAACALSPLQQEPTEESE